ncbi:MAG: hypothetical protein SGJ01_15465 [Gemmatimonadota bacterium]|nr:hypothetical protein [Gemmatimonadota bacterium]
MPLKSIRNFEERWVSLRKLLAAQLKDLKADQKTIAKQVRQYKVMKDAARLRGAIAHSRQVERALAATSRFIATKDRLVKEAARRGKLLKRALR